MYNKDMILATLNLQCEVNDMLDPEWTTSDRSYLLAAIIEIGELAQSSGNMWWVKNGLDKNNMILECSDILAFVLSHQIRVVQDIDCVAEEMLSSILDDDILKRKSNVSIPTLIIDLSKHISDFYIVIPKLQHILCMIGYTMSDLLLVHKHKSMLNMHRFKHGYADGTYTKVINGVEDNEALLQIIKDASDDADYESHFEKLSNLGYI